MRCPKCKGPAKNVDVIDCGYEAEYVWECEDREGCGFDFGTYDLEDVVKEDI